MVSTLGLSGLSPGNCLAMDWDYSAPCKSSSVDAGYSDSAREWLGTFSPYTHHWNHSDEHKHVFLASLDHYARDGKFCGIALFRNSFGQPSIYAHVGQEWNGILNNPDLFAKVSAGLIWGYRDAYQNKIPFNHYGVAPAIIPSVGVKISKTDSLEVFVLGNAGILFAYGHGF